MTKEWDIPANVCLAPRQTKSAKAIDSFINLLDDEDINGHIIAAMKYYKNKDLIPYRTIFES